MKIVQGVGWYYPDSWGGTEIYVAGLAQRLRAAGHDVAVAVPDPAHDSEREYAHEGIRVYRYPIPSAPTRDEAQGERTVRGAERFHRWLAAERPDVVHLHTFVTGLGLAEVDAARAAGARVIVTTHAASLGFICARGTMMRWGAVPCDGRMDESKCAACMLQHRGVPRSIATLTAAAPSAAARLLQRLPGLVGRAFSFRGFIRDQRARQDRLLSTVDKFVLLTDWSRSTVLANGAPATKVAVNRLGIADRMVQRKPGPDARPTRRPVTFGYVGRFERIKGAEQFVRAVMSLPESAQFRATLIGPQFSSDDRRAVDDLRRTIAGNPKITIGDPVPHSRIFAALADIDVLCCPSLAAEGGPTVAIEAHAVGTPVIGSRIGGLAELVTDGINGRLVAPDDWRALAGVMTDIVDDPLDTVDRWRRALPRARTLDEVARAYLELYAA